MWSAFYDGWMHFIWLLLDYWISTTMHCNYKAWKSQDILNITLIVFVWKKKVIYTLDGLRVSKLWGYFHFWVNYSLKMSVNHYRGSLGVVHPKMIIYRKCTYTQASKKWMNFLIRTDLEKCYIKSLAHQWILCSEWVPSEWESKHLLKTSQQSTSNPHDSSSSINVLH